MRLRVGVVGLGGAWRNRHRPALMALSDRFDVRAVCAEVAVRAEQVASEFDASAVDGFRALTKREDIDAVLVLAPEWYGLLPVLAACESGKAVYCAAALDMEPDRAEEIKRRVVRSGVAFMAEFPRRHAQATLRLKELIATRLGQPRLLFCHERQRAEKLNGSCGRRQQTPALRSLMESVDWCRYVVGKEPSSVVGVNHQVGGGIRRLRHVEPRLLAAQLSGMRTSSTDQLQPLFAVRLARSRFFSSAGRIAGVLSERCGICRSSEHTDLV